MKLKIVGTVNVGKREIVVLVCRRHDEGRSVDAETDVMLEINGAITELRAENWNMVQEAMEQKGTKENYPSLFLEKKSKEHLCCPRTHHANKAPHSSPWMLGVCPSTNTSRQLSSAFVTLDAWVCACSFRAKLAIKLPGTLRACPERCTRHFPLFHRSNGGVPELLL